MQREIQVGSITWLNGLPTPLWFAGTCENLQPAWVPRMYMVLKATSNPAPEPKIADFKRFQAGKQYRALTYCRCQVDLDSATGQLTELQVLEAIHDPGWTPPFRYTEFPPSLVPALFANPDLRDTSWYPGEASALSRILAKERHENSAIEGIPENEQVLVSSLLKCRAGSHPNQVGIRLGSPFHAPWVWNEWVLTYAVEKGDCPSSSKGQSPFSPGQFKLYVRASRFPSHAWYVDGRQMMTVAAIGDASFPEEPPTPPAGAIQRGIYPSMPPPRTGRWIHLGRLALYPAVLSKGAPASDPQTPNGTVEQGCSGPVATHPNTVPGWRSIVIPL